MSHSFRPFLRGALPAAALLLVACGNSAPSPQSGTASPGGSAGPGGGGTTPPVVGTQGSNIFMAIVPPGSNGNSAGGVGAPAGVPTSQFVYPKNFRDQLDMYGNLAYAKTPLKADTCTPPKDITQHVKQSDQACNYFKAAPLTLSPGAAIWDVGSMQGRPLLTHVAGLPSLTQQQRKSLPVKRAAKPTTLLASSDPKSLRKLLNRYGMPMATSNWIAVSGSLTKSGHPIAVAGPQTGYDVPQLLWEAAVVSHGGTPLELAARGISTVNLPYVVIGHGLDFAWSPTSAEGDIQDTRVSKMCNVDGSTPSRDVGSDGFPKADGYLYKGQCVKFYKRTDTWTANPTAASLALGGPQNPETVKRFILRTHYGPVTGTALVGGQPVAISLQRSTFLSDVDTAAPFALLTTTGKAMNQTRFKQLFNSMSSVFHWLYIDKQDIAYFQSGLYPERHSGINPDLPQWGDGNFEWEADKNFDPTAFGGDKPFPARAVPVAQGDSLDGYYEWTGYLPLSSHVQELNPARGLMASWNNSGAKGWWAADSNGTYGNTHRVQSLFLRLDAFKASGRKFDIGNMIEVMGDAAYTDLRGLDVLPLILQLMKTGPLTVDQQAVVDLMQQWIDTGSNNWISNTPGLGAFRRDRNADGVYDFRKQVVLMDAWYQNMMDKVLPQMAALDAKGVSVLTGRYDAPRAQGSAYQEGWFQHMRRVFRTVLQVPGHQDYRALKCAGTGVLADCRQAVLTSLDAALAELGGLSNQANWTGEQARFVDCPSSGTPSLPGSSTSCTAEQYDSVRHTSFSFLPVPAIHWINRPTFQQAVEIFQDRDGAN